MAKPTITSLKEKNKIWFGNTPRGEKRKIVSNGAKWYVLETVSRDDTGTAHHREWSIDPKTLRLNVIIENNPSPRKRVAAKKKPIIKRTSAQVAAARKKMAKVRAARKTNPIKKKATTKKKAVKKPAVKKTVKRKPKTTVKRKAVQAVQSARIKPANRGAVIVGLRGLKAHSKAKGGVYTSIMFFNGSVGNVKNAWESSIAKAAIFPTAPAAKKVANELSKQIGKGTRLAAVSRNATPSHIEKIFSVEGGYIKKK